MILAWESGGRKSYGLVIEENISQGRSGKCEAFDNEVLADTEEFKIVNFEVLGLCYM